MERSRILGGGVGETESREPTVPESHTVKFGSMCVGRRGQVAIPPRLQHCRLFAIEGGQLSSESLDDGIRMGGPEESLVKKKLFPVANATRRIRVCDSVRTKLNEITKKNDRDWGPCPGGKRVRQPC